MRLTCVVEIVQISAVYWGRLRAIFIVRERDFFLILDRCGAFVLCGCAIKRYKIWIFCNYKSLHIAKFWTLNSLANDLKEYLYPIFHATFVELRPSCDLITIVVKIVTNLCKRFDMCSHTHHLRPNVPASSVLDGVYLFGVILMYKLSPPTSGGRILGFVNLLYI